MPNEAQKLIEQVAADTPGEFRRVKKLRNLGGGAFLTIITLSAILDNFLKQSGSECLLLIGFFVAMTAVMIWLREIWKCPVCYETPGWILTDPNFCNACGARLEE